MSFLEQIQELLAANGWEKELSLEVLNPEAEGRTIRIRLPTHHPVSPLEVINEYTEGVNPLEQIQQECLRALRTGHSGL